jgi:hypothetical protein
MSEERRSFGQRFNTSCRRYASFIERFVDMLEVDRVERRAVATTTSAMISTTRHVGSLHATFSVASGSERQIARSRSMDFPAGDFPAGDFPAGVVRADRGRRVGARLDRGREGMAR